MPFPELDTDGFLRDPQAWDCGVAEHLASHEGLTLTDTHWALIELARGYYAAYERAPNMRPLVKLVRQAFGEELGSSLGLMALFTDNPAKQLSKIAGLPKPSQCI